VAAGAAAAAAKHYRSIMSIIIIIIIIINTNKNNINNRGPNATTEQTTKTRTTTITTQHRSSSCDNKNYKSKNSVFVIVVSYTGAEAWTLTKKEEQVLLIFERKIFRRIYGPKYENAEWKSRTNRELEEMSKGENIVKWIKGQRISWLGYLER